MTLAPRPQPPPVISRALVTTVVSAFLTHRIAALDTALREHARQRTVAVDAAAPLTWERLTAFEAEATRLRRDRGVLRAELTRITTEGL